MSRRLVTTLILLAILACASAPCAYCNSTEQTPGTVAIAYRFTPNESVRYRINQHLTGTQLFPGSSTPTSIDVDLTTMLSMRCSRVLTDGSAEVTTETQTSNLKMDGKPVEGYLPVKEIHTFRISPTGVAVEVKLGESGENTFEYPTLDFGSVESVILTVILPDKPVSIGESWMKELPVQIGRPSKLKLTFTLEGIKQSTATIKQVIENPISPETSGDPTRGTQEGEAKLLFSMEKGRLLSAQGKIRSDLTAVPASDGTETETNTAPATFKLESKFTVESL